MSYYGYYDRWPAYVPVAQRKKQAEKRLAALKKKGMDLNPVQLNGRQVARTFWGQSWCRNLESYSDYSNRLPRGRSYLRQGAVLDLKIAHGKVSALVQGSSLYKIEISIRPIPDREWNSLIHECSGKIDSLIELLQGSFSKNIMEVITRPQTGLFPHPKQIELSCSCPDWAEMCKHVAAVLYGVGARLDEKPELLFTLRQVDHEDLIRRIDMSKATRSAEPGADGQILAEEGLEEIFGIDLAGSTSPPPSTKPVKPSTKLSPRKKTLTRKTKKKIKKSIQKPIATKRASSRKKARRK